MYNRPDSFLTPNQQSQSSDDTTVISDTKHKQDDNI